MTTKKTLVLIDGENIKLSLKDILGSEVDIDTVIDWRGFLRYLNSCGYDVIMANMYINPFVLGASPWVSNNLRIAGIKVVLTSSFKVYGRPKSLSDPEMIVDGVSILYERPFIEALVIVSGDRDFLPLAEKAVELGKTVIFAGISRTMANAIKERFEVIDLLEFVHVHESLDSKGTYPMVEVDRGVVI